MPIRKKSGNLSYAPRISLKLDNLSLTPEYVSPIEKGKAAIISAPKAEKVKQFNIIYI